MDSVSRQATNVITRGIALTEVMKLAAVSFDIMRRRRMILCVLESLCVGVMYH